jgi:hypothetical protein
VPLGLRAQAIFTELPVAAELGSRECGGPLCQDHVRHVDPILRGVEP